MRIFCITPNYLTCLLCIIFARSLTGMEERETHDLDQRLLGAAWSGNGQEISKALEEGAYINTVDEFGRTPLHYASRQGKKEAVDILTRVKLVSINACDQRGWTPLYCAVHEGYLEIAKILINAGAYFSIHDDQNLKPLHLAANQLAFNSLYRSERNVSTYSEEYKAFLALLRLLLKLEILHKSTSGTNIDDALLKAATTGDTKTINTLMLIGSTNNKAIIDEDYISNDTIDYGCIYGMTPLHAAAYLGDAKLASDLLQAHAAVDVRDQEGWTPLHVAIWYNQPELVKILSKAKAHLNVKNDRGWQPLHYAADSGNQELVEYLTVHGADIDAVGEHNLRPIDCALLRGHQGVIRCLIAYGARLTSVPSYPLQGTQENPLKLAADNGLHNLVKVTLEKAFPYGDLHILEEPLISAVVNGHIEVLKTILEEVERHTLSEADARELQKAISNTFVVAAAQNNLEAIHLLIAHKALVDEDTQAKTFNDALIRACLRGHKNAVTVILKKSLESDIKETIQVKKLKKCAQHIMSRSGILPKMQNYEEIMTLLDEHKNRQRSAFKSSCTPDFSWS